MTIFSHRQFAETDTRLRAGAHVTPSEYAQHVFVAENFRELKAFYRNYDCTLIEHPSGFFYLNAEGSIIPTAVLTKPDVHLGQVIALMSQKTDTVRTLGVLTEEHIIQTLRTMFTLDRLKTLYVPKSRTGNIDEHLDRQIRKSIRVLHRLNFVRLEPGGKALKPTVALNRFVDIAVHNNTLTPAAARDLEERRGILVGDPDDLGRARSAAGGDDDDDGEADEQEGSQTPGGPTAGDTRLGDKEGDNEN